MDRHFIARFAQDRGGTSVLELAFVFPMIMFMLLGAIDYGLGFAQNIKLEQAVNTAIQEAQTIGPRTNDYDYLRQDAADRAGQPVANVTLTKWLECDGAVQPDYNGGCSSGVSISRYISLRVTGTYTPPFDYGGFAAMFNGTSMSTMTMAGSSRLRVQ